MNKYLLIGAIVILIIAGGSWFMYQRPILTQSISSVASTTQNKIPTTPEKTAILLPPLEWKVGDKIGDFTLTNIHLIDNPPFSSYPYYLGTADFVGTTTVHGFYRHNLDYSQWEFKVVGNDVNKIPSFPLLDKTSKEPDHVYLCLVKNEVNPDTAFSREYGEAMIQISGYTIYAIPKGESKPDSTCSGLVDILQDKILDPQSYEATTGF